MDDFWLWLYSLPNIGSRSIIRLRGLYGSSASPMGVFSGLRRKVHGVRFSRWKDEVRHLKGTLKRRSINVVPFWSMEYPPLLGQIHDYPAFLFCKGDVSALQQQDIVTVVGTRSMTEYGRNAVEEIVHTLTENSVGIVSGLANGVDRAAHVCAMTFDVTSVSPVAVLPGGPEDGYPTRNGRVYRGIVKRGCAVWEFVPGTPIKPGLFALRNRILAGLSKCTIVIESGKKGGSLIPAQSALENDRDVAAVPGSIFSESSSGTNQLIHDGAHVVRNGWDVLSVLRGVSDVSEDDTVGREISIRTGQAVKILKCPESKKSEFQSRMIEEGIEVSGLVDYSVLTGSSLAQALTKLEIAGILRRDSDGRIKMCR